MIFLYTFICFPCKIIILSVLTFKLVETTNQKSFASVYLWHPENN